MERGLITSLEVKYNGLDANKHLVDGVYLGRSIEGTAKLYNDALFLFENGKLPSSRSVYNSKIYMGVPQEGSLFLGFTSMVAAGQMAVYPELWGQMAEWFVPEFIKATYNKLLNKEDRVKQILEFVQNESQQNREFALEMSKMAIGAVVQDKAQLYNLVEKNAENNRKAARLSVEPVGRSCLSITQEKNKVSFIEIDEPSAEVIRSKEELEVTDMQKYTCQIEAVDKTNGSCRVLLTGEDKPIMGKIDDPQLQQTGNVYTHALDQDSEIVITAKTTVKKGEIQKFYISDAKSK